MSVKTYFKVTKPHVWSLLVYTGSAGYLIASGGSIDLTFLLVTVALILGTAGANTVTSYFDQDIDRIMFRTMNRPIPKGDISPDSALYYGLLLVFGSVALSVFINPLVLIFMLIGLFDNIIIYSWWSKRRTPLNIILGAPSGGMPTLIGFAAYSMNLSIDAWILFLLVIVWTPLHIWTLALKYRDDYIKANVPMLTSIVDVEKGIKIIGLSSIILVAFSFLLPFSGEKYMNPIFLGSLIAINIIILYYTLKALIHPSMDVIWRLFKVTSPYLTVIYTAGILVSIL